MKILTYFLEHNYRTLSKLPNNMCLLKIIPKWYPTWCDLDERKIKLGNNLMKIFPNIYKAWSKMDEWNGSENQIAFSARGNYNQFIRTKIKESPCDLDKIICRLEMIPEWYEVWSEVD